MKRLTKHIVQYPHLYIGVVAAAVLLTVVGKIAFLEGGFTYRAGDFEVNGSTSREVGRILARRAGLEETPDISVLYPVRRETQVREELEPFVQIGVAIFGSRATGERVLFGYSKARSPSAESLALSVQRIPGVYATGPEIERNQAADRLYRDLVAAELLALPFVLIIALWFFRGLVLALLLVLAGLLTVVLGLGLIYLVGLIHPLSLFALNVAVGVGVGLSLDYSLLLISRAREQLEAGEPARNAVARALQTAGRTIAISSGIVAIAFASLLLFPIELLRSMGIAGMVVAATAGLVSLTALPAVLLLLRHRFRAHSKAEGKRAGVKGGWYRIATAVTARPLIIAIGAGASMLILASPASDMRLAGLDTNQLPTSPSTQTFYEHVSKFEVLPAGDVQTIYAGSTPESSQRLKREILSMPGAISVKVLQIRKGIWALNVQTRDGPFEERTVNLVEELRDLPLPLRVGGKTASYLETTEAINRRLPYVFASLGICTLFLLLLATRSLLLPPKTFVMNLLSLAAGFGLLVFIFQEGHGSSLFGVPSQAGFPLVLPVMIVLGAFGLLTDYGLFVLLRIKEERENGRSNREAIAIGLQSSGRVVTVAALMFCIAVGALITSEVAYVKEAAFGLVVVVALDASIVRILLVPSLMMLLGRWNWWLPFAPSDSVAIEPAHPARDRPTH